MRSLRHCFKFTFIFIFTLGQLVAAGTARAQSDAVAKYLWLENGKDPLVRKWSTQHTQKTAQHVRGMSGFKDVEKELRKIYANLPVGPLTNINPVQNNGSLNQLFLSGDQLIRIFNPRPNENAMVLVQNQALLEGDVDSAKTKILSIPSKLLQETNWTATQLECLADQSRCILQVFAESHYTYFELDIAGEKAEVADFDLPAKSLITPRFVFLSKDQVLSLSLLAGSSNNQAFESITVHKRGRSSVSKIHQESSTYAVLGTMIQSEILPFYVNQYYAGFFNATDGVTVVLPIMTSTDLAVQLVHVSDKQPDLTLNSSFHPASFSLTPLGYHKNHIILSDDLNNTVKAIDEISSKLVAESSFVNIHRPRTQVSEHGLLTEANWGIMNKVYFSKINKGVLEQSLLGDGAETDFSSYHIYTVGRRSHLSIIMKQSPTSSPSFYLHDALAERLVPIWDTVPMSKAEDKYEIELLQAVSADGTKVPYTVVSLKDEANEPKAKPTVIYGYGGFGVAVTLQNLGEYLPLWVDRGNRYVFAHIRGGNEFGASWHTQAQTVNRHKVYEDAIAIAEDLIARKLSSPEQLAITGHSNGGHLAGVVATQRPDLFALSIPAAGVLDMTRFHLFAPGEFWIPEYGNPEKPEELEVLLKFSPVHNVEVGKKYPTFLILTAGDDKRVDAMHSRKFTHALEEAGHESTYLFESYNGDHGFYMGTFKEDLIFRKSLVFTMLRTLETSF